MKRALILATLSTSAIASTNYTQDARDLSAAALCGATNTSCQTGFKTGATVTAASKRLETTYKAIRAAEAPPAPPPPPPPTPVPAPTPAPVPPPVDPNVPTTGLAIIPSNFDINTELVPAWGSGAIPPSAAPDVVGAFRFICNAAHLSYGDPINRPGQKSPYVLQYYGNDAADENSTYESLRTTGKSTCMSPLNRSLYYMPAMLNGLGQVVRPDYISVYYKRRPDTDPLCAKIGKACVPTPRGLKFSFGFNPVSPSSPPTGALYYNCIGTGVTQAHYHDLMKAMQSCPAGSQLGAIASSPECWDGKNLDSLDHRSHVAYSQYIGQSYAQCPSTHPYVIPTFTQGVWYTTDATGSRTGVWDGNYASAWHLSSDEALGLPPGATFHSGWFGGWDSTISAMWTENCINGLKNASGGDLCNSKQLRQMQGFSYIANPRLVPIPAKP